MYVVFLQIRQEKICTKIIFATRSCFVYCFHNSIIVKAVFYKFIWYLTKNIVFKPRIRPLPDIRPDIRYPALGLAGYPAKTVSGASLIPQETIELTHLPPPARIWILLQYRQAGVLGFHRKQLNLVTSHHLPAFGFGWWCLMHCPN
jgi:hypothetical protein